MSLCKTRRFASTILLAAIGAVAQADYPQAVLNASPVAYWRFETVNATSSVNGFTATFVGNATVTAAGGGAPLAGLPNNRALLLDGAGDYVNTSLDTEYTFPTASTVIAWINLSLLPSMTGRIFEIVDKTTSGRDFALQLEQTSNRLRLYSDSGSSSTYIPASGTLFGQWHLVAASFDTAADSRRLYWDGQLVTNDTWTGSHSTNSVAFRIGEGAYFTQRFFQGRIDEVALFDRALSSGEIANIYLAASVPEPEVDAMILVGLGLVGWQLRCKSLRAAVRRFA